MNDVSEAPGTDLIPAGKPLTEILTGKGELERVLDEITKRVRSEANDPTTKKGREAISSLAYKVARSKTALDNAGKELGDDYRAKLDAINERRRLARETLEGLAAEVRKPKEEWEAREKARISRHQENLETLRWSWSFPAEAASADLQRALDQIDATDPASFEEFAELADQLKRDAREKLATALEAAIKREQEAEELARLRAEKEEREKAEREAEAKRRAEEEAKARAEREEKIRQEAAEKAAAEERARLEAEQKRKEAEEARKKEAERVAEEKRQANKRHREKVRKAATDALYTAIGSADKFEPGPIAESIFDAIDAGEIPHVRVDY